MKGLKTNLKRGFTLVELIVVMVIIAILGGVGFNAFSNYIAEANLTKYEDQFAAKQNAVAPKFSKSFTEGSVIYSVETSGGTPDNTNEAYGYLRGASFIASGTPIGAGVVSGVASEITLNGDLVKVIDSGTTAPATGVPDNSFRDSSLNELLIISEDATGNTYGTYYKKITDANICNSDAFAQKSNTTTRRYVGAGAENCFIANTSKSITLQVN